MVGILASGVEKLRKGDADIDHILSQNYGGGDGLDNLQCLCRHCNRSKQDSLSDTSLDYLRHNAGRVKKEHGILVSLSKISYCSR